MNKEHTLIRLVDDDESLLFSTKILLEALGWKVAAYNSPTEFLVRDNLSIPGCAVL
ncbi:MAG TPA: DNA-binding response regulator, partial [Sutterellaceae bacterium]|nr:DNA-binding response regulator [Sutterellaceae bacterium]